MGFSLDYKPIEVFGTPGEAFGETQRYVRVMEAFGSPWVPEARAFMVLRAQDIR